MSKQESHTILSYYLKKTGISFNKNKFKQLLSSHPERHSLNAMVDVLDELNIKNIALRVGMDQLQTNGFPAIIHYGKSRGKFIVVEDITEEKVHYYDAESGNATKLLEEFAAQWSGVALYAAQDAIQAELERKKNASQERLLRLRTFFAVVAGLTCAAACGFSVAWSLAALCLFSLCALGLTVSVLLTMHDFGESNRFLHKVCHINRVTNCNAVLHSSAAKLFGWLSMSDIGLCYFIGSIFSLIFAGVAQQLSAVVPWLLVLSLCAFPYTVFSLWYQIFTVKKICPLCLGVIGVLWAEMALAIFSWSNFLFFPVSPATVFSLLAGFSLPVIAWAYVKPLWKEYIRIRDFEIRYLRLKRTPEVIHALLAKEPPLDMEFSRDEINLGTINAPIHVTVILSFHCNPCVDGWDVLNRWLITYPDSLSVTVRFFGYNLLGAEIENLIDALTEINNISGNGAFRDALTDWYKDKDIQKWKAKHLATKSIAPQLSSVKNAQWIRTHSITSTPSVFVGNRIFPSALIDLESLLKEQ